MVVTPLQNQSWQGVIIPAVNTGRACSRLSGMREAPNFFLLMVVLRSKLVFVTLTRRSEHDGNFPSVLATSVVTSHWATSTGAKHLFFPAINSPISFKYDLFSSVQLIASSWSALSLVSVPPPFPSLFTLLLSFQHVLPPSWVGELPTRLSGRGIKSLQH